MRWGWVLLAVLSFWGEARESRLAVPVPGKSLFTNQQFSAPVLSPDGRYIALFEMTGEAAQVGLIERSSLNYVPLLNLGAGGRLKEYFWLSPNHLFFTGSLISKGERQDVRVTLEVIASEEAIAEVKAHVVKVNGYIMGQAGADPTRVLFTTTSRSGDTEIYVVDPMALADPQWSGKDRIRHLPDDMVRYFYDSGADMLLGLSYDNDNATYTIKYRKLREKSWQVMLQDFNTDYTFEPMGFLNDTQIAVLSDISTDKIALYLYDIPSATFVDVLYEHESYDLVSAEIDHDRAQAASVRYYKGGEMVVEYLNAAQDYHQAQLNKSVPGRHFALADYSAAADVYVAVAYAPDAPTDYYLFDVARQEARILFSAQPELDSYKFSKPQVYEVASGGSMVESYYYPPVGPDNNVLLVMPHGGPVGVRDTTEFNRLTQFYTTRGYAVLKVNFRGSFGFGRAFREGGVGEFGQQIEQDILAAITKIQQVAPAENICAMGSSYGGYSSLMLSILHPDLVDCVISRFGVYDLPLLFNQSNLKTDEVWASQVSETVGEYSEDLYQISPLYLANKITTPLLITAGYDDKVASFEHTQRLDYVLSKLGIAFEHVYYKNAGHGHPTWQGDIHENVIIEDFIRRTLGLKTLEISTQPEEVRAGLVTDLTVAADAFYGSNVVDHDETKAFTYYQKAAANNDHHALYKLALAKLNARETLYPIEDIVHLLNRAIENGSTEAANFLVRAYLFNDRFDGNQSLVKQAMLKVPDSQDDATTKILETIYVCLYPQNGIHNATCADAFEALPAQSRKTHGPLLRQLIARLITEQRLTEPELNVILNSYHAITTSRIDTELVEAGRLVTQVNGQSDYQSDALPLKIGDRLGVKFTVSAGDFFVQADEQLGAVVQWIGLREDGTSRVLKNMLFYGSPKQLNYFNYWRAEFDIGAYDATFKAIKLLIRDVHSEPKLEHVFQLH